MKTYFKLLLLVLLVTPGLELLAQKKLNKSKEEVLSYIDDNFNEWGDLALSIWNEPELGYMEEKSSGKLQNFLRNNGFSIESGVAGMPTSFIASYGSGAPVIAVLAEFDALPGLSQAAVPFKQEREGISSGHACGHHLFGTGGSSAAIAVKNWMESNNIKGTVRVYGTPAEEGGSGKVYMARDGLFDDVDAALYWHAGSSNSVRAVSNLAIVSVKFRFHGISTHAAGAPFLGRSALDAVESMNFMVNMMREHVTPETRIHYVITRGGEAPNVVPAFSEVYYFIRHPQMKEVKAVLERIAEAAKGAAQGTGTTMDYEVTGGSYNVLSNQVLAKTMQGNLEKIGGVKYDEREREFALKIMETYPSDGLKPEDAEVVQPLQTSSTPQNSSTDSGDVSWVVPLVSMRAATWPPGTSSHSWQAVAAGGTSIGLKGMNVATKTLALTLVDLFSNPELVIKAKEEYRNSVGEGFKYESVLGDRNPALDYMKSN